jgi:PIN domain nuclease of toxin-antitoxin system
MGMASGLVYGWLIDPVKYVDTQPNSLRIDYQTDIVLMVASIYSRELDTEAAIERLSLLENEDIGSLLAVSLAYADEMHFSIYDIDSIEFLNEAISNIKHGSEGQP